MTNILNIGTSITFWIVFLKGTILALLFFLVGFNAYKLSKLTPKRKKWKQRLRMVVISVAITVCYIFFAFVAFGPGESTKRVEVEDVGTSKLMKEKPTEKPVEEIRREAYERKPEQLKRQDDPSFTKEKEEADKQMDAILERAEKRKEGK